MFDYSGGWSSPSSTLSWGHGRPTSFDHQERSPGASGRGSGRQLLLSSPASEQFEVEPDLRSSTSSDIEDRARPPTPERFKRYSLKRTSTSRSSLQGSETGGVRGGGVQPHQNLHQRPEVASGPVRKRIGGNPAPLQLVRQKKEKRKKNKTNKCVICII